MPSRLALPGFAVASRLLCLLMAVLALGGQMAVGSIGADRLAAAMSAATPAAPMCGSARHVRIAPPAHPERFAAVLHPVAVLPSGFDVAPLLPAAGAWLLSPVIRVAAAVSGGNGARAPPPRTLRPQPRGPPSSC